MHRAKEEEHQPDEDDHPDQEPERTSPPFLGGIAEAAVVGAGFGYRVLHHAIGVPTRSVTTRRSAKRATTKTAVSRSFERVVRCCTPSPQIGPIPPPVDGP